MAATSTNWSVDFDTTRRQKIFSNPPKDNSAHPALAAAIQPHLESFNALFENSKVLSEALRDIGTKVFLDGCDETSEEKEKRHSEGRSAPARNRLSVRIRELFLDKAQLPSSNKFSTGNREIYPSECRERHASYRGRLKARFEYRVNNHEWKESIRDLGQMPIMVKSNRCHIEKCSPAELVNRKEDSEELGGYFIINGNERLIRMLIVGRRNYPTAISRPSYTNRGHTFTPFAVSIRCVRPDQTSQTNHLHYLNDGNVTFRFSWRKAEYLVPVLMILKALIETNDREIFEGIVGTAGSKGASNTFVTDRVEMLLRTYKAYNLHGRAKTLVYLGEKFRPVLGVPSDMSDEQVGHEFLRRIVLPHLGFRDITESQNNDKFQQLLFMIRKLYAVAAGDCAVENPDAVSNQEVLLGGYLYGMLLKERLDEWLMAIGPAAQEWCGKRNDAKFADPAFDQQFLTRILKRTNENIGGALEYFLSTGNLVSSTGLDLQQTSGYTVVAEKINFYRFISHFRMIHRGSFFAQLKTTTVRKLLPESWGFLCPIHTPDGAPCGLLNHLAHKCQISTGNLEVSHLPHLLAKLGISPDSTSSVDESVVVQLDGRILGYCTPRAARKIADVLRHWKVEGKNNVPLELEIGYVPNSNGGQYPGIYLFSQAARMMRPVKYLALDKLDMIGPFEQPFMEIAVKPEEVLRSVSTHVEFTPTNILSILANMTPFSDFNQSPRNMYQCQMSKQTMGTPTTALQHRTDNKAYLLQTGQTPIARPPLYNEYGLDNFPNGTNAIVAVISYTGYDMDDAFILNKSAHERGFGDGVIYKTKKLALDEKEGGYRRTNRTEIKKLFGFAPESTIEASWREHLDEDGFAYIGKKVNQGDLIAAYHTVMFDPSTSTYTNLDHRTQFMKYSDAEEGYVDQIRILGSETGSEPCQAISVKFRIPRRPVIGDKFSSRHGQKGVCSQLWPTIDMPFSESGIQPDIIINPHAFPSRMTIGMFVESLAGKAGALHGFPQDSTPFQFSEDDTAGDYFGHQLMKAGYNFHGNEPMYSGITGEEFAADIYLGVVYYQRLRHMVNDKFQVRTTGPINSLTGQPVKGRAKGGGIRIGEMERDALLAHGTAFLLQDRLMNCSDAQVHHICRNCGSFLSTQATVLSFARRKGAQQQKSGIVRCKLCSREAVFEDSKADIWEDGMGGRWVGGENTTQVSVPGVLRYLDVELSAMGVKMKFKIEP